MGILDRRSGITHGLPTDTILIGIIILRTHHRIMVHLLLQATRGTIITCCLLLRLDMSRLLRATIARRRLLLRRV